MKRAAFRADASREIGTGHVIRCLTLAEELRRRGWDTVFLCKGFAGNLIDRVRAAGHDAYCLPAASESALLPDEDRVPAHAGWLHGPWNGDAQSCEETLTRVGPVDWLVVDHYALDSKWEGRMRKTARRILSVDDLADRDHDCDILVDQNFRGDGGSAYDARLPASCARMLGPRYALLRPEFQTARENLRERGPAVDKVLVFLGGADPENFTGKVLEALDSPDVGKWEWHVVLGPANPHADALTWRWAGRPRTFFHRDVRDMARLIASADLAVAGGGISTWERLCLGLPTVAMSIAFNQEGLLAAVARLGLVDYAGRASDLSIGDLALRIAHLAQDPDRRARMASMGLEAVDGLGVERVAERMVSSWSEAFLPRQ